MGDRTYFPQEPSDDIAKDDCLVGLMVIGRGWDAGKVPKVALPFVQPRVLAASVEQDDLGGTLNQPSPVEQDHAFSAHGLYGCTEEGIFWFFWLYLHRRGLVRERADEAVSVSVFRHCNGDLCLDDGVDTAYFVGDLPCALEQQRVANIASGLGHVSRSEDVGEGQPRNVSNFFNLTCRKEVVEKVRFYVIGSHARSTVPSEKRTGLVPWTSVTRQDGIFELRSIDQHGGNG